MPNVEKTPRQTVRVEAELWQRFGDVVDNRSETIRAFIAWFVRERGAKLPGRPPRS